MKGRKSFRAPNKQNERRKTSKIIIAKEKTFVKKPT